MKRIFDIILCFTALAVLGVPMLMITLAVKFTSRGPVLYWSDRVGKNNIIFKMPKFRTMRTDTPPVATHLLTNPKHYLTPIGAFLRKTSLDELPQLFSIFKGEMSLVGPRPALFNQHDLIKLRTQREIHLTLPGITGLAQINGRDDITIPSKVNFDEYYVKNWSFFLDIQILLWTFIKVVRTEGVKH